MSRILTTLGLVPFAVYAIFFAPHIFFISAVVLVAVLCFLEFDSLVRAYHLPSVRIPGLIAGVSLLFYSPVFVLASIVALSIAMLHDLRKYLPAAGALLLGVFYIFGAWRCGIEIKAISTRWFFFALAINWVGDIAALYVGRAFGQRKLAPEISPGKSWEGSIGSSLAALAFGYVFATYIGASPWVTMGIAFITNVAGQAGDLAESALKRGAGVKDSGTLLPGHGGLLDRLDSSLFTMPVVWTALKVPSLSAYLGLLPR
ncbi:MAG TPA: phosphatidate cytidylyltransferase [Bryobacteraceae bacterium]|nr:phosphatidate cytidylyltransferase [Bryobacteraceae bacterium]